MNSSHWRYNILTLVPGSDAFQGLRLPSSMILEDDCLTCMLGVEYMDLRGERWNGIIEFMLLKTWKEKYSDGKSGIFEWNEVDSADFKRILVILQTYEPALKPLFVVDKS